MSDLSDVATSDSNGSSDGVGAKLRRPADAGAANADSALGSLHRLLQCPVCLDALVDPMTLACGHSLCHACMRRSLDVRPACPCCGAAASATTAVPSLVLRQARVALRWRGEWGAIWRGCGGAGGRRPRSPAACHVVAWRALGPTSAARSQVASPESVGPPSTPSHPTAPSHPNPPGL